MTWAYDRRLALSGIPVKGRYRYNDLFQILPVDDDAPQPPAILNHHPFIIEYRFKIDETPRVNPEGKDVPQWVVDIDDSLKTLKEILLLLTVFSLDRVFTYSHKQSWFISNGTKDEKATSKKAQWGREGYRYDTFESEIESLSEATSNPIELCEVNEFFNRFGRRTDEEYDLPENIDELITAYFSLEEEEKHYFLTSCELFNQGMKIWTEHPSLSFAAFVSSIETLIAIEHKHTKIETCNECGQERYQVIKKFREFFGKYGSPSPEFKKHALKIYKCRSKILHRGELFLGEVTPRRFGSIEGFEDDQLRRSIISTCRICFVNWLLIKKQA